ncbi:energy transducer TonB [Oleiharenicola lentus]|nr:energy transducer TonB [Oleiharenicola lentus]
MKNLTIVLLAIFVMQSGCSSFKPPQPLSSASEEPVRVANRVSIWGEFPSYETTGHYFRLDNRRHRMKGLNGRAVVDVLVNADGTIRNAALFESSGSPEVDALALRLYRKSRYSLRLAPGHPAPHVVRQEFTVRDHEREPRLRLEATNYGALGPNVTPPAFPESK